MAWLTIDKPLEKCPTVHAETGKRCELFAWHSDYHYYSEAQEGGYVGRFWLSGFDRPSPWSKTFHGATEITFSNQGESNGIRR